MAKADQRRRKERLTRTATKQLQPQVPQQSFALSEEDKLLIKLKEDMKLPWKEIAEFFEKTLHKFLKCSSWSTKYRRLKARVQEESRATINEAIGS